MVAFVVADDRVDNGVVNVDHKSRLQVIAGPVCHVAIVLGLELGIRQGPQFAPRKLAEILEWRQDFFAGRVISGPDHLGNNHALSVLADEPDWLDIGLVR